jgi:CDGSH-type Zn-finger protein/uncharacterized Fe-S cluster protein YjdI
MSREVREYASDRMVVEYDVGRCIHAAECVKGLPSVFDPKRRPWIDPTQAEDVEALARVIERCPTGALQYRSTSDDRVEEPGPENMVRVGADGPLYARGDLRLKLKNGELRAETRLALCRCGQSKNKPYCDNTHEAIGFEHDGTLAEVKLRRDAEAPRTVEIEPLPDGPVLVSGDLAVAAADGSTVECTSAAFCRCGHSSTKPFCDGAHKRVGFSSGD